MKRRQWWARTDAGELGLAELGLAFNDGELEGGGAVLAEEEVRWREEREAQQQPGRWVRCREGGEREDEADKKCSSFHSGLGEGTWRVLRIVDPPPLAFLTLTLRSWPGQVREKEQRGGGEEELREGSGGGEEDLSRCQPVPLRRRLDEGEFEGGGRSKEEGEGTRRRDKGEDRREIASARRRMRLEKQCIYRFVI